MKSEAVNCKIILKTLFTLFLLCNFINPVYSEKTSIEILNQINEQKLQRSKVYGRKASAVARKQKKLTVLTQKENIRKMKQDEILKEHLMAIEDIKERMKAFDGDIDSCVRKIMHTELKQVRDEQPGGKNRTVKPYSSPSADISNINTDKNAKPQEDNSSQIMTSGDPEAVLREMSPAIKLEFIKKMKEQYGAALHKHEKKYEDGIKKLSQTEEFSVLIEEENKIKDEISQIEKDIQRNERKITRYNLRIQGLKVRLDSARMKENLASKKDFFEPEDEVAGDSVQLDPPEEEKQEKNINEELNKYPEDSETEEDVEKKKDLEDVKDFPIIEVTAGGKMEEDYSAGEFKNIVTSTLVISFKNVGSQVPGCGGVFGKMTAVASINGSQSVSTFKGTFTGGPDGVIKLNVEGEQVKMKLSGGKTLKTPFPGGLSNISVSNPGAFKYWKK